MTIEREGKAVRAEIGGKKRLFLYSLRVAKQMINITEKDPSVEDNAAEEMEFTVKMAISMMNAGDRYAKAYGIDNPPPMTEDELMDLCDISDLNAIAEITKEAMKIGQQATIIAGTGNGDEKNATAKPET